jgi:hypothetical protein
MKVIDFAGLDNTLDAGKLGNQRCVYHKEALPAALQKPLIVRALEELEMLTKTDEERERYEARRKAQLDHNTGLKVARLEGEKIGMIHLCERLLNRPQTSTEQLTSLSWDDLSRLADDLQEEVLKKK